MSPSHQPHKGYGRRPGKMKRLRSLRMFRVLGAKGGPSWCDVCVFSDVIGFRALMHASVLCSAAQPVHRPNKTRAARDSPAT